jgi:putative NIF3 family GTP cyclohydrolase 1 type 2
MQAAVRRRKVRKLILAGKRMARHNCRMTKLLTAVSVLIAHSASAQKAAPTAMEVIARIREHAGVTVRSSTVDTFKAGDSTSRVTGIAVTMMATLDVLERAVANGDNLVITHEPTFYTSRDTLAVLESENDKLLAEKQKYIREHGLIVWRFHDIPHAMSPDMIRSGVIRALGWQSFVHGNDTEVFDLPRITLRTLSNRLAEKLGAKAVRISGDPESRVAKAVLTQGFWGFASNRHAIQRANPDVVIIGEDHEWETIEYVVDAISAGRIKGLIVLGHVPSEQAGMEEFARWLRPIVPGVRVDFVPTRDPFRFSR